MNGVDKLLSIVLLLFEKMFACCIRKGEEFLCCLLFCCNDFVMRKVFGMAKMLPSAGFLDYTDSNFALKCFMVFETHFV